MMLRKLFNFKSPSTIGDSQPKDTGKSMVAGETFLQRYGHLSIKEMISDWQEIDLVPNDNPWADFPPQDFVYFNRSYPRTPFDGIPAAPNHIQEPSFLLSQAHRIWQTTSLVYQRLKDLQAGSLLDVGSF